MNEAIAHAADLGVPLAGLLVPLSGIMAILGGLSIVLGCQTSLGAWTLVAFLLPLTLMMHAFWNTTDNLSRDGAPPSVLERRRSGRTGRLHGA